MLMRVWIKNAWKQISELMQWAPARRIFYILVVVISLVFIAYAVYANWNELKGHKWEINYLYIFLPIVLYPLGMMPTVAAWHKLLEALGIQLPFSQNLRIYALSLLPRHIPGLVWYVSSRTLLYKEKGVAAGLVLTATAVEVFLQAVTGFLVSTLLLLLGTTTLEHYGALQFIIPIALLLAVGLVFSPPLFNRLSASIVKRMNIDQAPTLRRGSLIASLIWLLAAWSGGGLLLFLLVRGFSPVVWFYFPVMIGVWGMASSIGLTIGIGISGMGLREITLGALLSLVISPITAVVVAVAFRLVLTISEFIWVFIFAWLIKSVPRKHEERMEDST
jgi:hypothetical protein